MRTIIVFFSLAIITFSSQADFSIIAHRGASGFLPEHTFASTVLAHAQGADFIEQDVVLSKDGIPLVLHDIHLENTTDVAQIFPSKARKDGRYYAIDFTLAEINKLTVNERKENNSQVFKHRYQGKAKFRIATLADQIELVNELNRITNKNTGLYIEVKAPAFHRKNGLDISQKVLTSLRKFGLDSADAKVYVQCFDFDELKRIRKVLNAKVKLIQLIGENSWQEAETNYDQLKTLAGMKKVAQYADGIGPWLGHITAAESQELAPWVQQAKSLGLLIHPYTYRTETITKGKKAKDVLDMIINKWRVDGLFTDQIPPVVSFVKNANSNI